MKIGFNYFTNEIISIKYRLLQQQITLGEAKESSKNIF